MKRLSLNDVADDVARHPTTKLALLYTFLFWISELKSVLKRELNRWVYSPSLRVYGYGDIGNITQA
jgi:hypothetical protein